MLALRRPLITEPPSRFRKDSALWQAEDHMAMEAECQELVWALVRAIKPLVVVEVGTWLGSTAEVIGNALESNGRGQLQTFEIDERLARSAAKRCQHLPRVNVICADAATCTATNIDLLLIDGDPKIRRNDGAAFNDALAPNAFVIRHDVLRDGNIKAGERRIVIPTPRGLSITQMR